MADKVYTVAELKTLVLTRVNQIQKLAAAFVADDATEAYDTAVRECGFVAPISSDDYINLKNEWLIRRMSYWFYYQVRNKNLLLMESGDMKAGSIVDRLTKILAEMDAAFEKAKTADTTAILFTDSVMIFGSDPLVVPSGYVNDGIGEDLTKYTTGLI